MEQERVQKALEAFNDFLQKPDGFACHQAVKIASARSRETIQKRTFENVVSAYQIIFAKLQAPENLYANLEMKPVEEVSNALFATIN
jgi:hypothetical protein